MSNQHSEHSEHFIVPLKFYIGTFVALLFLTFITVFVARFDFGSMNIVIAMFVALIKASLVLNFFMGVYWDKGFTRVLLLGSSVCVVLFLLFTLLDVHTRGDLERREAGVHQINSPVRLVDKNHHSEH